MSEAAWPRAFAGLAWGGRPSAWESCGALLAMLAPGDDVVATLPAGGLLTAMVQQRVAPRRLLLHVASARDADAPHAGASAIDRIALGARDSEAWPAALLPWPMMAPPEAPRIRKLDTLYADSHAPGLLILDAAQHPARVLHGAARVLTARRPMVLLDFTELPPAARPAAWEACVNACAAHNYAWHDGLLMPTPDAVERKLALLAAGHAAGIGLPAEWPHPHALPEGVAGLLAPECVPMARLAWGAGLRQVRHDDAMQHGLRVRFDDALPAIGLYEPEHDSDGGCWRWTGPGPRAAFLLPVPGPGPWRLRLDVVNWGVAGAPGALRALVDGAFLPVEQQDNDFISFAPLRAAPFRNGAAMRVDLTTPRTRRASALDARQLGVSLSAASVSLL